MFRIQNSNRRAFTMVELMMVIGVIALMLSLLVGASYKFILGSREAATATTVTKVNQLLQDRLAGFRHMDFTDAAQQFQTSWNSTYIPVNNSNFISMPLAEVLVRKIRMKRSFPQNATEAFVSDPVRYASLSVLTSPPLGYVSKYESGIVLYALLVNGETFGTPSVGEDAFSSSEVRASTETANLPCLVDSWGEPLRFYRWPTRLIRPLGLGATTIDRTFAPLLMRSIGSISQSANGGFGADGKPGAAGIDDDQDGTVDNASELGWYGSDDIPNRGPDNGWGVMGAGPQGAVGSDDYEPLNVDSDDPMLLLLNFLNTNTIVNATSFEQGNSNAGKFWPMLHTPFTYHPMLVVSAGPDRQLGLFEPTDLTTVTFGYLAAPDLSPTPSPATTVQFISDNITNLNLSSSGK